MPRLPSQKVWEHFWEKQICAIFGPKIGNFWGRLGVPGARWGCSEGWKPRQNKTRGGNHQNWGVALGNSALEIAMQAVQPKIRPFSVSTLSPRNGPKTAKNDPKRAAKGAPRVLRRPNCVPCTPDPPRSGADPDPGPPGARAKCVLCCGVVACCCLFLLWGEGCNN